MQLNITPSLNRDLFPWASCSLDFGRSDWIPNSAMLAGKILVSAPLPSTLKEQVELQVSPNFQRYVFDALPRSAKLRPLVPANGRFFTLGLDPQNPRFPDTIYKSSQKVQRFYLDLWDGMISGTRLLTSWKWTAPLWSQLKLNKIQWMP